MPLTHSALDMFVSQEMSRLTNCAPQSLADEFPEHNHWLDQFVLRRIFHNHIREDRAALAFVLVRRAAAALDEWELACVAASNVQTLSGYFKMLRHMENCISALWQGLEFIRRALQVKLFDKGDGSSYERLNWVYNVGRHFDPQELPSGNLHRLWISNDGVNTQEHVVTFVELRDAIKYLAGLVQEFAGSSPKAD